MNKYRHHHRHEDNHKRKHFPRKHEPRNLITDYGEDHISIGVGDYLDSHRRYQVIGINGKGTFSVVLEVFDLKYKQKLSIKVIRSVERYLDAAWTEIDTLEEIRRADIFHNSLVVSLYKAFEIERRKQKHVFERLGDSLYTFLKNNLHRGYTINNVREFGYQLLHAVHFCHSMSLIHTDLKPENVLLVDDSFSIIHSDKYGDGYHIPNCTDIRLIDFGGATFSFEHHSRIINTRQYRAIEVILNIGWSFPSDLWSIGCILVELYTGDLLFPVHQDLEHLAMMEHVLEEKIPIEMTRDAIHTASSDNKNNRSHSHKRSRSNDPVNEFLDFDTSRLLSPDSKSIEKIVHTKTLKQTIDDADFLDLIQNLLRFDPKERFTAEQALSHSFFSPIIHKFLKLQITAS